MDFFDLFSSVPESLIVVSPDYTIIAATDEYLQVTMRSREAIVGKHFLKEAFPEKDVPYEQNSVKKALDSVSETKQALVMDVIRYDLPKPDEHGGEFAELYWETSYIPSVDETGQLKYIIQKAVNVTERELAKRRTLESETKFKIMTNTIPQLVLTTDGDGKLNYLNNRWVDYAGVPEEVLLHSDKPAALVLHPDDLEAYLKLKAQALQDGNAFQMEIRIKGKDGNFRWFLSKSTPVRHAPSERAYLWVNSCTDIHANKQMVQELLESTEQMSELADQVSQVHKKAESRRVMLEQLIMQAPVAFCILSGPEHRYDIVNANYQQLIPGKTDLIGRTVEEVFPEIREQGLIDVLDNVYNTGEIFSAKNMPLNLMNSVTGELEERSFTFVYQPIFEAEQQITGILVCAYETSAVKVTGV